VTWCAIEYVIFQLNRATGKDDVYVYSVLDNATYMIEGYTGRGICRKVKNAKIGGGV
jgi:hypothetical protein